MRLNISAIRSAGRFMFGVSPNTVELARALPRTNDLLLFCYSLTSLSPYECARQQSLAARTHRRSCSDHRAGVLKFARIPSRIARKRPRLPVSPQGRSVEPCPIVQRPRGLLSGLAD